MISQNIRKLAKLTSAGEKVDKDLAFIVLNKLSRKELLIYLRYLKALVDKKTVRIFSREELPKAVKEKVVGKFKGKATVFETDPAMGDGIKVVVNDTIINLTMTGYIENAVEELKTNLW